MSRMVFCRKYQQELQGLDTPPYPGVKGLDIYEHISQKAWQEWTAEQTMLINEKKLNMMNAEHRKFLQEQMDNFFSGKDHERAEGYVPTKN